MNNKLLMKSRGVQEELFQAIFLDDQIFTIDKEAAAAAECGVRPEIQDFAGGFLQTIEQRIHETESEQSENRSEMATVLVVDVNLPELTDISTLDGFIEERISIDGRNPDDLDTDRGRRAGVVLVDVALRGIAKFRKIPVVMLSAYGSRDIDQRLQEIARATNAAPVKYLDKASKIDGPDSTDLFKRVTQEFLHDKRLYFIQLVSNHWDLADEQVCGMLGVRGDDLSKVAHLFDRASPQISRDPDSRCGAIKKIQRRLHNLLRGRDAEIEWLCTPNRDLHDDRPIDLITGGHPEKLYTVEAYVDFITGH